MPSRPAAKPGRHRGAGRGQPCSCTSLTRPALGSEPSERPRAYLARGPNGLETGLRGSIDIEIIERAGRINVAHAPGQHGLVHYQASPEQVIVGGSRHDRHLGPGLLRPSLDRPALGDNEAVRRGRAYLSPTAPFGLIDRPPSVNRMIGLKWLAGLFYPDHWRTDLREETRDFYRLWYGVEPANSQLDGLLELAMGCVPRSAPPSGRRRAASGLSRRSRPALPSWRSRR